MKIAITPGEPAGIGPDLAVMIANLSFDAEIIFFADQDLLHNRAEALRLPPPKPENIRHVPIKVPSKPGQLNIDNVEYVLETVRAAATACLQGEFDALVTGPVNKAIISQAGRHFPGHTEFLQDITNSETAVMMLAHADLRVALATTHLPLNQISNHINQQNLEKTLSVLHEELIKKFGIKDPIISVCGLNPHAGEDGELGREEIDVIIPVIQKLKTSGKKILGPLPADTAFTKANLNDVDSVLAMYHDQGLPVIKHASFGEVVNITLGLPIIRTSVDHGTALSKAGTNNINCTSLIAAIEMAIKLAKAHAVPIKSSNRTLAKRPKQGIVL